MIGVLYIIPYIFKSVLLNAPLRGVFQMKFLYNETTLTSSGSLKALLAVDFWFCLEVWNARFSRLHLFIRLTYNKRICWCTHGNSSDKQGYICPKFGGEIWTIRIHFSTTEPDTCDAMASFVLISNGLVDLLHAAISPFAAHFPQLTVNLQYLSGLHYNKRWSVWFAQLLHIKLVIYSKYHNIYVTCSQDKEYTKT